MMRERGILFSAPMVRAILDGRKTMTRRICKHEPAACELPSHALRGPPGSMAHATNGLWSDHARDEWIRMFSPYGLPGDRLWVRETWAAAYGRGCWGTIFGADGEFVQGKRQHEKGPFYNADDRPPMKWRPSIFLPRWASRITLEITGVRVERVDEISEEDAKAEGVTPFPDDPEGDCWTAAPPERRHRTAFEYLWGEINGWHGERAAKPGHSFQERPFVWAITFRRIEPAAAKGAA